jgi:delta-aminolevulinic acid dehydratase/porphobilinogen synthase
MVTEYELSPSNFILPLFVKEGIEDGTRSPIPSMPGAYQHSIVRDTD